VLLKKINIKSYTIEVPTAEGKQRVPYDVVTSIENVVLATGQMTSQRLSMPQLLEAARIIEDIKAQVKEYPKRGYVLLEDAKFAIVDKGFNAFSGFGLNEVELCKRIANAEEVKVKEDKEKKKV